MPYLLDWIALSVFFALWGGYTLYANRAGKRRNSLSSVMHHFRIGWMARLLSRQNRVADMSAVSNLERNSAFFASSSLFVVAGLLTVLAASDQVMAMLNNLALLQAGSRTLLEIKIGLMIAIYVFAFLGFTWSMRQYGFVSVLLGAAYTPDETPTEAERRQFVEKSALVMDLAARQFNYGLRAFYFSLAALSWLVGPWALIISSIAIVLVLYRREFHSGTLHALVAAKLPE